MHVSNAAFGSRQAVINALLNAAKDWGWKPTSRSLEPNLDLVEFKVGFERAKIHVRGVQPGLHTCSVDAPWGACRQAAGQVEASARRAINQTQVEDWSSEAGAPTGEGNAIVCQSLGGTVDSGLDQSFPVGTICLMKIGTDAFLLGSTTKRVVLRAEELVTLKTVDAPIEGINSKQHSPLMRRRLRAQAMPQNVLIETAEGSLTLGTGQEMTASVARLAARIGGSAAASPGDRSDVAAQIAALHRLHSAGALTAEEFSAAKAQVLDR